MTLLAFLRNVDPLFGAVGVSYFFGNVDLGDCIASVLLSFVLLLLRDFDFFDFFFAPVCDDNLYSQS